MIRPTKKILFTILTVFGANAMAPTEPPIQTIDAKDLRFSMPTVAADDIHFVMPTKESFEGAPQFHEDEWCQLEFFPQDRLAEIQKLLNSYKIFEQKNRIQYGWKEIYARRINRRAILQGAEALNTIAKSIQAKVQPAPILTTSSRPLGQVKDGFTLELPGTVLLYGLRTPQGVSALGAIVAHGGDNSQLTKAFIALSKQHKLILVDWRAQQVLVAVNEKGQINVWQP